MAGLLAADQGSLDVLGFNPATEAASIHTAIGYMPQRFGLYEDLTVAENLTLYADLRALPVLRDGQRRSTNSWRSRTFKTSRPVGPASSPVA